MLNVFITNLGKYNEGELIGQWLKLPCSDTELETALSNIGINDQYEEYFITAYETDIDGLEIGEYEDIYTLNESAEILEDLDKDEKEKLMALLEYDSNYFNDIQDTVLSLDDVHLYSGVNNEEDLGYRVVEEGLFRTHIPDNLKNYIDYESIGSDWYLNTNSSFTSYGFLEICA